GQEPRSKGPSIVDIRDFLTRIGKRADVSGAHPTNIAGREAYSVSVSPKHDGGLLGSLQLAWNAAHAVPLRVAIYARGASSPVLALEATDISYGPVPSSDVDISPPADAKKSSLGQAVPSQKEPGQKEHGQRERKHGFRANTLASIKAQAGFKVVAPDTLLGLPRRAAQLVGGHDSKTILLVYGHGLGAIVVAESRADSQGNRGPLGSLPAVSLDGATGHELATQLGTVLTW